MLSAASTLRPVGLLARAKRLDERVLGPDLSRHFRMHPLSRLGLIVVVIFGGHLLLRLVLPLRPLPTFGYYVYGAFVLLGLALCGWGAALTRRPPPDLDT